MCKQNIHIHNKNNTPFKKLRIDVKHYRPRNVAKLLYFIYIWRILVHVCLMFAWCHGGQKRVSDILKLKLHLAVIPYVRPRELNLGFLQQQPVLLFLQVMI